MRTVSLPKVPSIQRFKEPPGLQDEVFKGTGSPDLSLGGLPGPVS